STLLNTIRAQTTKRLGLRRDAVEIVRGVLSGDAFSYDGETWSADVPALSPEAHTPRGVPPAYVAAPRPKRQARGAARRAPGVRRCDCAYDAGARRRDRGRVPDAIDHDAGVRALHLRERRR